MRNAGVTKVSDPEDQSKPGRFCARITNSHAFCYTHLLQLLVEVKIAS